MGLHRHHAAIKRPGGLLSLLPMQEILRISPWCLPFLVVRHTYAASTAMHPASSRRSFVKRDPRRAFWERGVEITPRHPGLHFQLAPASQSSASLAVEADLREGGGLSVWAVPPPSQAFILQCPP